MVSQRGILNLFHTDAQRDAYTRRGNAMILHGADAELLDREGVRRMYPFLNFDHARFPIKGGLLQSAAAPRATTPWPGATPRAPTARRGHHPELRRHRLPHRGRQGARRRDDRGIHRRDKVGVAVAGNSSRVMGMAGMRLPSKPTSSRPS
jgi:sarcosine oxidase subunit beta